MFFLITDQPAALLPTIVSRCRVVRFHPLTEEACQKRLIALGQSPEMAKKKARIAEGCVGRALEIDDGQLDLRMELTHNVFSVHHPADALGVVNMYKEDKERQKLVLDTLEIALRDILVQQAGGASVADAGYAREALDYASRVPLSGGLTLMETLRRRASCSPATSRLHRRLKPSCFKYRRNMPNGHGDQGALQARRQIIRL